MFLKLATAVQHSDYAFIIDRFFKNYSIIGFSLESPFQLISSNSIEEFFTHINEKDKSLKNYLLLNKKIGLGWYGYFSYDLKNQLLPVKIIKKDLHYPLINFIYLPIIFLYNHKTNLTIPISNKKFITIKTLNIINKFNEFTSKNFKLEIKSLCPYETYAEKIKRIKKEIEKGNVYQVNYAHNIEFKFKGDALSCYLKIREKAKPAYGAYFKFKNLHILSFSPECFFQIKDGKIISSPIKGTTPRSSDTKIDKSYKFLLNRSPKDKAEHLMIVDLIRNDLGKICKIGSIEIKNLFKIISYPTVHHMVSNVKGILKKDISLQDVIKAMFPGGSITGAPKISAINLIEELEDFSRGIYTGAIGYFIPQKYAEFNIAIRTLILMEEEANYPVGGGIVYDSDPKKEYEETITKSEILSSIK